MRKMLSLKNGAAGANQNSTIDATTILRTGNIKKMDARCIYVHRLRCRVYKILN